MVNLKEICKSTLEELALEVSYTMADHDLDLGLMGSWSPLWNSLYQNDGKLWCVVLIGNKDTAKMRK